MPYHRPFPLRNRVLILAVLVAGITYLDRVCIGVAAPTMMADLHLTNVQMGYVFSAFSLSYGMLEIPMGWLGDHIGQRKMLTRIAACWSAFTALTGMTWGYLSLIVVRFAFGAAEAGAFPSMAQGLARWFKVTDRGKANGMMWMGARIGGAIAPVLATELIVHLGWRLTFSVFGTIGTIWCVVFWCSYRDDPAQHPAASVADIAYACQNAEPLNFAAASDTPWKRIFLNGNLWAIFWMYFATSYGFWFLLTWLPTYLIRQDGLSVQRAGLYSALPLAAGAVTCAIGGASSDWLVARIGSRRWGRRLVGQAGYLLAGAGFAAASALHRPFLSVVCLTVAEAGMDLAVPVAWVACLEIGGRFGGTATGFMNTASSISAAISPLVAAWCFERFGSFNAMLMSAAVVYFLAAFLWLKIDATQTLNIASQSTTNRSILA